MTLSSSRKSITNLDNTVRDTTPIGPVSLMCLAVNEGRQALPFILVPLRYEKRAPRAS